MVGRLQSMDIQNAAPVTRLKSEQEEEMLEGKQNVSVLFSSVIDCNN